MKYLVKYLAYRLPCLVVFAIVMAVCFIVAPLYALSLEPPAYILLLSAAILLVGGAFDYAAFYRRIQGITQLTSYPEASDIPIPRGLNPIESPLAGAISALQRRNAENLRRAEGDRDMVADYFTTWAHQIKTPIAAMSLILQKDDSPQSRNLKTQLFKTEQYVEMAMAYTRLDSPSNDFVFRRCRLDDVVRQAVKKYATLFIAKGISVDIRPTGLDVLTDEKWLCFALEQIISNAVKYTPTGGRLLICRRGEQSISLSDNGIGIAPEDLPRIWERGYTGYNGRSDKRASGIGLYLTRMILHRLGHSVSARSEVGKGTTVTIDLKSRPFIAE